MNLWLFILIGFILAAQAVWIFLDARKRGESYWLWGFFGLLNFPSSLIIYLLVTRTKKITCPDCGRKFSKNNNCCPHCGGATLTCPGCHEQIQISWVYCPYCSCKLKEGDD
ncbi:hypothetical protein BBF96_01040 [Anoxybacter fermentans]|uniref:DZANK-type domain-containing protein n=1 Tax=Anoxybacter fermentans TaxID=1323375 RepID=A0A3S9SV12_9FIRM|nr:zinc ribbon domain-containing protein [Anoxybacter fermentans]AZR72099.1 hypothetical protein BBF96_01040 [Anoxybacter fermentans]